MFPSSYSRAASFGDGNFCRVWVAKRGLGNFYHKRLTSGPRFFSRVKYELPEVQNSRGVYDGGRSALEQPLTKRGYKRVQGIEVAQKSCVGECEKPVGRAEN